MMNKERHIIEEGASMIDALARLNSLSGQVMTLLVTDNAGVMKGTLTDGDIRRALLRGVALDAPVAEAMHKEFRFLRDDCVDVSMLREMRRLGLRLIPLLDACGRITRLIDTQLTRTVLPVSAILMAGGKGERLRPMTLTTPKPLLKVGEKAIIDYNIEALAGVGVKNVWVTTNYLAEQLEEHFATPVGGIEVRCVRETLSLIHI